MPSSYSIASSAKVIEEYFNVEVTGKYEQKYNASPTKLLPVITAENPDGLSFFYWGINPAFVKPQVATLCNYCRWFLCLEEYF